MNRWLLSILFLGAACKPQPAPQAGAAVVDAGLVTAAENAAEEREEARTHRHVDPLAVCPAKGKDPLVAARQFYDGLRFQDALSCAAQACAFEPDDPEGHSERGAALAALLRFDEAKLAYARVFALDPEHLDGLLGAAHLFVVALPSTRELDELGLLYAERGLGLAETQADQKLSAQFAVLSAMAFNDLGQPQDALARAQEVLGHDPQNPEARYERAVSLFELNRFMEAQQAFTGLLTDQGRRAHAHHHLGLILERTGQALAAQGHFRKARALAPEDFPEPVVFSKEEFAAAVDAAVEALPQDMRRDLANVPVAADELPRMEDLEGEPPLSPTILGIYRGPPISEACRPEDGDPCRSVALFRKNLVRAVGTRAELLEQIRVTLWHEVGHLRGEDDFELAARGLE